MQTPSSSGHLWIVATPIGNIGDLSPRGVEILQKADILLAEDTRIAAKLFRDLGLPPRHCLSFYEHNEAERIPHILEQLKNGKTAAIISDAGTPLLSDPGYRLVRACRHENLKVIPIPGPCAPVCALSAAGLAPVPFSFLGFLPRGNKARADLFRSFSACPGSIAWFERKDRLAETLDAAFAIFGPRPLAICRELTKIHEEFILGRLGEHNGLCDNILGEITVIVGPPEERPRASEAEVLEALRVLGTEGLKNRQAARRAQDLFPGWTGKELYKLLGQINK